jgi:hypothetical protein
MTENLGAQKNIESHLILFHRKVFLHEFIKQKWLLLFSAIVEGEINANY